ncbi:MAG: hypothetical protein MJ169_01285 [Treponema sp.]|nr:hypothetical protein [Treponema sp.]
MKKSHLLTVTVMIMLLPFMGFSQEASQNSSDDLNAGFYLKAGGAVTRTPSADSVSVDFMADVNWRNLEVTAGIEGAAGQAAFMAQGRYWFLSGKAGRLAPFMVFEFDQYKNISFRTNTFLGIQGELNLGSWGAFGMQLGGGLKTSTMTGLSGLSVINWDVLLKLYLDWNIRPQTKLEFSIASYEDFRYPMFMAPVFGIEFYNWFNSGFMLGAEIQMRTIDLFTLSSYVDGVAFKIAGGIRLK